VSVYRAGSSNVVGVLRSGGSVVCIPLSLRAGWSSVQNLPAERGLFRHQCLPTCSGTIYTLFSGYLDCLPVLEIDLSIPSNSEIKNGCSYRGIRSTLTCQASNKFHNGAIRTGWSKELNTSINLLLSS